MKVQELIDTLMTIENKSIILLMEVAVVRMMLDFSSFAITLAKEVLPKPGGPNNKTCSIG